MSIWNSVHPYTGQAGRAIETRIKEHVRYIDYKRTEKSVVAEHVKQNNLIIDFSGVRILNEELNFGKMAIKKSNRSRIMPGKF